MNNSQETPQGVVPRWAAPWSHGWATLSTSTPIESREEATDEGRRAFGSRRTRLTGSNALAIVAAVIAQFIG